MDQSTATTHSFIVKIWLEETIEEAGRATWRGHITHVFSGKRHYLQDLDDIATFITPYIEGMGGQPGFFWRMRKWCRQLKPSWLK
jgi:hypothetical protein